MSPSSVAGGSGNSESASTPKPPPFVACALCRRSKVKCIVSDKTSGSCDRCREAGCICFFEPHKRGRKRTRGSDLPRVQDTSPLDPTQPTSFFGTMDALPMSLLPEAVDMLDDHGHDHGPETSEAPLAITSTAAHPLPFISGSRRPFSLHNMLHTRSTGTGTPRTPPYSDTRSSGSNHRTRDVIDSGMIPAVLANRLFTFFMENLNPVILLFDPDLHTLPYIRARSPFLLAAILSCSARFIAPTVARSLAQTFAEYTLKSVLNGRRTVETIQSWMLIYFWKTKRDDRAWTYVGLIARAAIEIGLDCTPLDDAPFASDTEQRERRNRIRTWLLAYMMDRSMSSATGRDWCLRGRDPIIQSPRKFSDHPLRLHGDAVIAGFGEMRRIASDAMDILTSYENQPMCSRSRDVRRHLLSEVFASEISQRADMILPSPPSVAVNYDLDEWNTFWTSEVQKYNSPPIIMTTLRFFELHVRLFLNSFAVDLQRGNAPMIAPPTGSHEAEHYCHDLATAALNQLRVLHGIDRNRLTHAQDSIAIMVAYAAFYLRAVTQLPSFSQEHRLRALGLISDTSRLFKEVDENLETSARLQAEFLDSLASPTDTRWSHTQSEDHNQEQEQLGSMPSGDFDDWLNAFGTTEIDPSVNALDSATGHNMATTSSVPPSTSHLLPHSIGNTDLAQLGGPEWDNLLAQLLQLPPDAAVSNPYF